MCMLNRNFALAIGVATAFAASAWTLSAQEQPLDLNNSVKFNLPVDSPVSLLSWDYNESRATIRGGAVTLDLRMDLLLRNSDSRRVRGVTMLVVTQEASAFGRASVARLVDVGPGDSFPVKVNVRLMRPYPVAGGPLVQVNLDGVLFDTLAFYGPNRLNSKRSMTFWETEARRDRLYFKQVLASRGPAGLQQEMLNSLTRQSDVQRLDVRLNRGRATTALASANVRSAQFAFLDIPDAPVRAVGGSAEVTGEELRSPRIEVQNLSSKPVRFVEMAWLVKDRGGKQYLAGSVPASEADVYLPPGHRGKLVQDTSLRFSLPNSSVPLAIDKMVGVVSQVEFSDGQVWVPRREALAENNLLQVLAPSPEEQRLSDLYRTRGITALVQELKKF